MGNLAMQVVYTCWGCLLIFKCTNMLPYATGSREGNVSVRSICRARIPWDEMLLSWIRPIALHASSMRLISAFHGLVTHVEFISFQLPRLRGLRRFHLAAMTKDRQDTSTHPGHCSALTES